MNLPQSSMFFNCTVYTHYLFAKFISCSWLQPIHTVLHSTTAGKLTWRTQHAPKLLAAPDPTGGSLYSDPQTPTWLVVGLRPLHKNPIPSSVQLACGLPLPRNVDFILTPLQHAFFLSDTITPSVTVTSQWTGVELRLRSQGRVTGHAPTRKTPSAPLLIARKMTGTVYGQPMATCHHNSLA